MRKITLFMLLLLSSYSLVAQVLDQPANWPNANWVTSGTFEAVGLVNDPSVDGSFTFDDDAAGQTSDDDIASESPVIDLTAASTAGENLIIISGTIMHRDIGGSLSVQYWDADAATWVALLELEGTPTPNDFANCSNMQSFETGFDISAFTATQLSGFKYRYAYDDNDGWLWGWCIQDSAIISGGANPPNCDAVVTAPADGETGVDTLPTINWSAATGFPDGYLISIGTTDGGDDTLSNFDVGNALTYTVTTDLDFETQYFVTITPYNGTGNANGCTSSSFTTQVDPNTTVICANGPVNTVFCYENNLDNGTVYSFASDDGSPLSLTINSGQVENNWDELVILDSDGTTDLNAATPYGLNDDGDVAGISYQSSGDTISLFVQADGSFSCQTEGYTPIDFNVSCATCTNPVAEYALVEDCDNGEQFIMEVNITDLGSAGSVDVTDNQGSTPQTVNAASMVTMGPYPNGTNVTITITNNDDGSCVISSTSFTQAACPPDNDLCVNATPIACGESDTGNTSAATEPDAPAGFCGTGEGAPGVWYSFEGNDMIVTASLCNSTFDTKIQVYEGSCDALNCIIGEDDDFGSCGSANPQVDFIATTGTTYYIYVFGFGANVGEYTLDVTCIDIPTPPANDECADATVFLANEGGDCVEFGSGTIFGATASAEANSCGGTADDDVWFEFVAVSTDHAISLQNIVGDTQDLYHVLYQGDDCNNLTEIYCSDPNQSIANGLTIGDTYKVRVYSWTGNPLQDVTFDICVFTIPPPIYVSSTDFTVEELVQDVLIDSECNLVFNISSSTGTDFGADNGIGYFERNGSDFPFERGLILTSGNAEDAPGPEDETLSGGNWPGDADLENVIPALGPGDSNDATIIEFDFIPVINTISFDFIFAAEEYGTFQCGFSDSFAFLLTDVNGVTTNLAIVPGTVDPISVFTVRDNAHNGGCDSVNPEFFDTFYGATGEPELVAPIDFRGHTTILTAMADVTPNDLYTIKLVIADANDSLFDSAVFLGAGSFDIGQIDLGDDILLASGDAQCEGDVLTLDAGEIPNNSTLTWFQDGIEIDGTQNQQTIDVTTTAFYRAEISIDDTDCTFSDEILIEFFANPELEAVTDNVIRCVGLEVDLEVVVNNSDIPETLMYTWFFDGVEVQSGPESIYTITSDSEQIGVFTVTVQDSRGCTGETTITVIEGTFPVVVPVESIVDKCIADDATLEANVSNPELLSDNLTYIWSIDGMIVQESNDNTYIHAEDEPEAVVTVTVRDEASQCTGEANIEVVYYINDNCVDLPQGLSPNGDSDNDCLILDHLEDMEDIDKIYVFNRYGTKVFEMNQYVDQWCGTDNDGELLPVGTYFYTIYFNSSKKPINSWIYLNY